MQNFNAIRCAVNVAEKMTRFILARVILQTVEKTIQSLETLNMLICANYANYLLKNLIHIISIRFYTFPNRKITFFTLKTNFIEKFLNYH